MLQLLSSSQLQTGRNCPARWGYKYVDGLEARVDSVAKIRGKGLHRGLAAGYEAWRDSQTQKLSAGDALLFILDGALTEVAKAHKEVLAELDGRKEVPEEIRDEVLTRLIKTHDVDSWAVKHLFETIVPRDYERKVPLLIEHSFDVPVFDARGRARHLRWRGALDLVMYDRRSRIIELHESKTVGTNAGSEEHLRRIEGDPQTTSYVYALRYLQKTEPVLFGSYATAPIGTVVVDVLRRKKPAEPKVLADGTVSTDQRIDTLPEVYRAALERQEETPEYLITALSAIGQAERENKVTKAKVDRLKKADDRWEGTQVKQQALLEQLSERGDRFIASHEHFVTEDACERWRSEVWIEAERLRRLEVDPRARTRNLGYCTSPGRGCSFRTLCYSGGDEQVRSTEFTTPEEREQMRLESERKEQAAEAAEAAQVSGWA
jgi:hypothetical protein